MIMIMNLNFANMITITEKELKNKKKPIQVYFETDMLVKVDEKLSQSGEKISVSDYIRGLVAKDLAANKSKKERKWAKFRWDNIPSDPREQDKIIYSV